MRYLTQKEVRVYCKKYMEKKPIKWVSSGCVDAAAKQDICMRLIFISAKRGNRAWAWGNICFRFVQEIRKCTMYALF